MKSPIIVVGIGEIGSVIAQGFLRNGYPVYPVTRDMDMQTVANAVIKPEAVLIAVGESELDSVLNKIPNEWKSKIILIQNELLPRDWKKHELSPTVISVWFEKKIGQDVKIVVPSPIYGDKSVILSKALNSLGIPTILIDNKDQMTFELIRKNYYILTSNIAGLQVGGTVGELWRKHKEFTIAVIKDVHTIQEHLVGDRLDNEALTKAMLIAFDGDPDHDCMGRSAPARLSRALEIAKKESLNTPTLLEIKNSLE